MGKLNLRHQSPESEYRFFKRLNKLFTLTDLKKVRIISAYANWAGIGLLSDQVENFLLGGGSIELVFGFNNGVTSSDSFLYGLYLKRLYPDHVFIGAIEDQYANSTFHSKSFEFWTEDAVKLSIGSANLTGAGLATNTETNVEIEVKQNSKFSKKLEKRWDEVKLTSTSVDIAFLRAKDSSGSFVQTKNESKKDGLKYLDIKRTVAVKPLFSKFLNVKDKKARSAALATLDANSQPPDKLYLQIFENETGGNGGAKGYQVQLPVQTLSIFFGVGPSEPRQVTFKFDGYENIEVELTHFSNNTHRVRLRPILDFNRPAVLIFERTHNRYVFKCSVIDGPRYRGLLNRKCTQQTREGSRKWGVE